MLGLAIIWVREIDLGRMVAGNIAPTGGAVLFRGHDTADSDSCGEAKTAARFR